MCLPNAQWEWNQSAEDAFNHLRQLLVHAPVLKQADLKKPFKIYTDASDFALGAVLVQGEKETEKPVEFASRRLVGAEIRYSTTEKEALAVVWALDKFKAYVLGGPVTVVTDHQPLRWLFNHTAPSGRLARWIIRLLEHDLTIEYLAGKYNSVADYLSRPPALESAIQIKVLLTLPIRITREDQLQDAELRKIITALENCDLETTAEHYRSRGYFTSEGLLHRLSDEENDFCPVVVPLHRRQEILNSFHGSPAAGHFGTERTLAKIATRFFWSSMRRDVKQFVTVCVDCQRYKPIQRPPAQLYRPRAPAQRFEVLSIDFMGPLSSTQGGERHILVVQDLATKWTELFPMEKATAEGTVELLVNEVCYRFGTPRKIISDRGTQLSGHLLPAVCDLLGIEHEFSPSYHPQANPVERRNRDIKQQLAIAVENHHTTWASHLPAIRFALNTSKCSATGYSPAYLLFGNEIRHPLDAQVDLRKIASSQNFHVEIQPFIKDLAAKLEEAFEIGREKKDVAPTVTSLFKDGDLVMLRNFGQSNAKKNRNAKFLPLRDGPYRIRVMKTDGIAVLETIQGEPIGEYSVNDLAPFKQGQSDKGNRNLPNPVEPKRNRGRPRTNTEATNPSIPTEQRRRPGRPPKNRQQ